MNMSLWHFLMGSYMRHASIVFTVFSYTSALVFLRPLEGHIDIDQSHVLGHMMIHPLTEAILGQGGDIPPGGEIPPFFINLNTGGDIPPFSDLTVGTRGWYPPPGVKSPPFSKDLNTGGDILPPLSVLTGGNIKWTFLNPCKICLPCGHIVSILSLSLHLNFVWSQTKTQFSLSFATTVNVVTCQNVEQLRLQNLDRRC